ncbi:MAG: hypothetical protein HYR88_11800 [Verrucomicrobia bacterium]|nr:hypothetical protein [Verrucomicrobiota bacterium]MBI3868240.1 hypothetical protein [Verrucomicrobiota bacterium]
MAKRSRTRKRLTRQQTQDLDIEIYFLEGVVQRDPYYVEAMKILSDDYLQRGHFDLGLDLDEKLIELEPGCPQAFFNLACSYSLNGQMEAAADALSLAIDYGYKDWKWIAREQSLEKLREAACYQPILGKIQAILTP